MVGALAFVFPGQGSQRAGMAAELLAHEAAARDAFAEAETALGLPMTEYCTTADGATLNRTEVTQPALLTISVAWLRVLTGRGVRPALLAGHSLGEFAAWVAAGVLTFPEALHLVRRRGDLMEAAGEKRPGTMLAVIGLPDARVQDLCQQVQAEGVAVVANYNSPRQVVVSGDPGALAKVGELVKAERGRALPLRVSGAFHSPLMAEAAAEFAALVAAAELGEPTTPVVANATAQVVRTAAEARAAMTAQMTSSVHWSASVACMVQEGIGAFLEVGPGVVLTKLIERIAPQVRARAVGAPAELKSLIEEIAQ